MLRSVKQLHGYKLDALDGEIGHVKGFYFDDKDWVVRYLVVDTGSWLTGRRVLISPYALGSIYHCGKLLEVKLTREKVRNSPTIETELPIARQHEQDYYRYYNWPVYWGGPGIWGLGPMPVIPFQYDRPSEPQEPPARPQDSHLRTTQEVTGYTIQALDGEIGHVEDFLLDDSSWEVRFLVVTTGHWWSGKNVVIPPQSILRMSWEESKIFVNLTRTAIQNEPDYEYTGPQASDRAPHAFG
jgi:hypothetical protein